jgi:hypothetical protein
MKKGAEKGTEGSFTSQHSPISNERIEELCSKLKITREQLLEKLLEGMESSHIPTSIFSNEKLNGFELVCRYLIEKCGIQITEVAKLLNRDYQTIWTEYRISREKQPEMLAVPAGKYLFPISILAERNLSVLESIVAFMKEQLGLKLSEIASELHRDQRNIWTVYKRANEKRK